MLFACCFTQEFDTAYLGFDSLVLRQGCSARNHLENVRPPRVGTYKRAYILDLAGRTAIAMMAPDGSCSCWLASSVLRDNSGMKLHVQCYSGAQAESGLAVRPLDWMIANTSWRKYWTSGTVQNTSSLSSVPATVTSTFSAVAPLYLTENGSSFHSGRPDLRPECCSSQGKTAACRYLLSIVPR